jgi:hypothetical protein
VCTRVRTLLVTADERGDRGSSIEVRASGERGVRADGWAGAHEGYVRELDELTECARAHESGSLHLDVR